MSKRYFVTKTTAEGIIDGSIRNFEVMDINTINNIGVGDLVELRGELLIYKKLISEEKERMFVVNHKLKDNVLALRNVDKFKNSEDTLTGIYFPLNHNGKFKDSYSHNKRLVTYTGITERKLNSVFINNACDLFMSEWWIDLTDIKVANTNQFYITKKMVNGVLLISVKFVFSSNDRELCVDMYKNRPDLVSPEVRWLINGNLGDGDLEAIWFEMVDVITDDIEELINKRMEIK